MGLFGDEVVVGVEAQGAQFVQAEHGGDGTEFFVEMLAAFLERAVVPLEQMPDRDRQLPGHGRGGDVVVLAQLDPPAPFVQG